MGYTTYVMTASGLVLAAMAGSVMGQHCSPEWEIGALGVPGTTGSVNVFARHNDGTGMALYAGGIFAGSIGGVATNGVAKWDGAQWSALGPGIAARITGLGSFNDGQRTLLYATGNFTSVGGVPMAAIARWDGNSWSPVGLGLGQTTGAAAGFVIAVYDDGTGPSMYVGGSFAFAGGQPALNIAKWDGAAWHNVGDSTGTVNRLFVWDDGGGPALFAGGNITMIGGVPAAGIARLRNGVWSALGSGVAGGLARVNALMAYNDGTGEALYVGGNFTSAGGVPVGNIARWNGTEWSALVGNGVSGQVNALEVFDDGSGPALFVVGSFTHAAGSLVNAAARYDGIGWTELSGGVSHPTVTTVTALARHDDGSGIGEALYIGGGFTMAGGQPAGSIARWACIGVCYPNCDGSTVPPIVNIDDFTCFISEFAAGQALPPEQQVSHYANCDGSTTAPVLNIDDFTCFINSFAMGCP